MPLSTSHRMWASSKEETYPSPSRAPWGSWAQSLSGALISLTIENSLHSTSMTFPEFQGGRFKQLLIREGSRYEGFPGSSDGKESTCNVRGPGSIPGSERSPGKGNGNPLQYSCLGNPTDREAWQATVHGVAKNWT